MKFTPLLVVATMALLSGAAAFARAGETPSPAGLTAIENALEQSELRQKDLDARRSSLLEEEEQLSAELVTVAQKLRDGEQEVAATAERIKSLEAEKARLNLDLAARQDVLSEVLAGLQRLEQNPPPALVVNPHDVLGALRSAMLFGTLAPELRQAAGELQEKLVELADTSTRLRDEMAGKDQVLASLALARGEMLRLAEEKRELAAALNLDLEAEKKKSIALAGKAKTLRELLDRIAEQAAKEAEQRAKLEAERLAAELRRKALAAIPRTDFADLKGQLAYPAGGQIAKGFGDDTGLGQPLDGIVISTAPAAMVTSPVTGLVEFAGPFRSYGEMVIINPGKGYLILLAGLGQLNIGPGVPVKAGEPVATMGEKPVAMALAKDLTLATTPMLYVEFRKNGEPVDPTPWWAATQPQAKPTNENQEAMR
jgi:septal ring factor EnvC (AmiA/AmiB activator)